MKYKEWLGLALFFVLLSLLAGSGAAFFQLLLQWAYDTFHSFNWLLWSLPLWVSISFFLYPKGMFNDNPTFEAMDIFKLKRFTPIDWSHAPLIVFATVLSHLGGASVGREGVALQMGAGISNGLFSFFNRFNFLPTYLLPLLTKMGMAAGFGALFQSPLAAGIFVFEAFPSKDKFRLWHFICVLACCFSATEVYQWFNVRSLHLPVLSIAVLDGIASWRLALGGLLLLIAGFFIAYLFDGLKLSFMLFWRKLELKRGKWLVLFAASCAFALLAFVFPFPDYYGLGMDFALRAFSVPMDGYEWLVKLFFTVLLISAGVKGGEVTPLFCIGALAGNAIGYRLGLPLDFFAATGLMVLFAFVSRAPLACFFLALEVFGFASWSWFLPFGLLLFFWCNFLKLLSAGAATEK